MVRAGAVRKRWVFAVIVTGLAAYDVLLRSPPVRLQPYLPGILDARSWLETNCRGAGRDIDKCQATIAALEGSGADAFALAQGMPVDDLSGRHYWLHIAAQNGSVEGMQQLGIALAELPDAVYGRAHHMRARFWLQRAADSGDAEANALLRRLPPEPELPTGLSALTEAYLSERPRLICRPLAWWRTYELILGDPDAWRSFNGSPVLPCKKVPAIEADVMQGKMKTGMRSPLFLLLSIPLKASPGYFLNEIYWGIVAAENGLGYGNTQTIPSLGASLVAEFTNGHSNNADYKMRGRFWLRKAAVGDSDFQFVLDRIQNDDLATKWLNDEP